MKDVQRREARYTRALAIGMGISLTLHIALFGFVRLRPMSTATRVLTDVTVAEKDNETVEPERPEERTGLKESTAASSLSDIAEWRPGAMGEPAPPELMALPDLSEAEAIARVSATRPLPPLVPRPRIVPATTEQGLTPVSVAPPTWMLADGAAKSGRSGGGIRIRLGSPGKCGPRLPALPRY